MPRLTVQHCVLNATTRQYGPNPTSDLLGVDYVFTVPADTEFPKLVGKLELFVRIFGRDLGLTWVQVRVFHAGTRHLVYWRRFAVTTTRVSGPVVIDRGFKLMSLGLPGEGPYTVRVVRPVRRRWDGHREWRVLATEHFWVRRAT